MLAVLRVVSLLLLPVVAAHLASSQPFAAPLVEGLVINVTFSASVLSAVPELATGPRAAVPVAVAWSGTLVVALIV